MNEHVDLAQTLCELKTLLQNLIQVLNITGVTRLGAENAILSHGGAQRKKNLISKNTWTSILII